MKRIKIAQLNDLKDRKPYYAIVANVDLVIIRYDDKISVFYGRCLHRGVLLADGFIEGNNLICGVHYWDYRVDSGVSEYNNKEQLQKFSSWVENDDLFVDEDEIKGWEKAHPQPYGRDAYQGDFQDVHGTAAEPYVNEIRELAENGLSKTGHHGPTASMGVERDKLPQWDDIQILTAQLSTLPLQDDAEVGTELIIGPEVKRPLRLDIPIFVSDMSYGALSAEAKVALAKGAELAGTGICSGEGGMLPEEQQSNTKYLYEYASGKFGFSWDKLEKVQAFHFKCGQGAKTGTGGHLPGEKVQGKIAEVRGLVPGESAISPPTFPGWTSWRDFKEFADEVREKTDGIPVGFKLSAQHIEKDIEKALESGADYIILDGRGGGTGAAPTIFRDNISIPTIPALARTRKFLNEAEMHNVSLIITGGLRTPADFVKALALGADGIAVSNAALQAIGCLGMRACNTNNCPVGIATQKEHLRERLPVNIAAERLERYFTAAVELMKVLARACGHEHLNQFTLSDLTTWKKEMAELSGIRFSGINSI